MLYVLPLVLLIHSSLGLHVGHDAQSPCQIAFPYTTSRVTAFYEQIIPGEGCSTNATTVGSQEVHTISLLNAGPMYRNDVAEVNLLIKSGRDELIKKPIIFVLSSHQPVRWKVRTEILASDAVRRRHVFVVPRYSSVRLLKSHRRRVIRRIDDMPKKQKQLLKWVLREYGAVTSFTELQRGNRIELNVGIEPEAHSVCEVKSGAQTLNAVASYEQPQMISGCDVQSARDALSGYVLLKALNPPKHEVFAYVIELEKVHNSASKKTMVEVELDIKSLARRTIQRDFWLVLKAPNYVRWKVQTKKIQGYLDIIANTYVDISGIRMDTVGVRLDNITDTGQELINWVTYYVGPVSMYGGIGQANKIKLVLPEIDKPEEEKSGEKPYPQTQIVYPAFENKNRTTEVFRKALRVECHRDQHMVVAFHKILMMNFALKLDQLSLQDSKCQATQNSTDIILGLSSAKCGTKTVMRGDKELYTNALYIHRTGGSDLFEEFGSGDNENEVSGSGSHDPYGETYFDDEDFHKSPMRFEVSCEVPEMKTMPPIIPQHSDTLFEITLYKTSMFKNVYYRYPMVIPYNARVYAEASIKDTGKQVQIQSCWLSRQLDRVDDNNGNFMLIEDGCTKDPSVQWHKLDHLVLFKKYSTVQRFSFVAGKRLPYLFLKCKLTACRHVDQKTEQHIPLCIVDLSYWCENKEKIEISASVPSRLITVGPLSITEEQVPEIPLNEPNVTFFPKHKPEVKAPRKEKSKPPSGDTIVVDGLDSTAVVGIAFAAFIIGVLLMAALWFIHTHTGPIKHVVASRGVLDVSGESTPMSTAPITINT